MLTNFEYNNTVISRREDGYINLSSMCRANSKKLNDFTRLKSTKAYLQELARVWGIPVNEILVINSTNDTWGHPSVAISLARWISAGFAVWCDAHIFNLMESGSTSLEIDPIAEMKLKIELARLEAKKAKYENETLLLRKYVSEELPKPIGDRILGVTEIKEIEYRDRIILDEDIINDGSTVTKAYLCDRYGFVTKKGTPSYTALNKFLAQNGIDKNEELWDSTMSVRTTKQFKVEHLDRLDRAFENAARQMYLGE